MDISVVATIGFTVAGALGIAILIFTGNKGKNKS